MSTVHDGASAVIARVVGLWRYPVKSLAGEALEAAGVGLAGIPHDRTHAVVDQRTGKALSAKRDPRLLAGAARAEDDRVLVTVPGVGEIPADDPSVHDALSAWLDRPVRLAAAEPGRRTVFEMDLDPEDPTAVTDLQTPPGTFHDSRSVLHLLTTASLAAARALHPGGDADVRRFRPNVLLTATPDGFVEDAWVGAELDLGDTRLQVRKRTTRCVLPTRAQPGLSHDPLLLRDLARGHDTCLGVYADPIRAGRVALDSPCRAGAGAAK